MEKEINNIKIKVVYNKKTGKMFPFKEDEVTGEIIILTTGDFDWDNTIVSLVDPRRQDLLNGYVMLEGVMSAEE
jgi:hypothetical protein